MHPRFPLSGSPIEISVEWPDHGRPLTLAAVEPRRGEGLGVVVRTLWDEVSDLARRVGVESPVRFRSIRLDWKTESGMASARLHPHPADTLEQLEREFTEHFTRSFERRAALGTAG